MTGDVVPLFGQAVPSTDEGAPAPSPAPVPSCPQCGEPVYRTGHVCRARAARPNWPNHPPPPPPPPLTDPDEVAARVAACRAALAATSPPPARPAASVPVLRERPTR